MLAILDGLHRTAADASHAMRAVVTPDGMSRFQFNIFQRTTLNTLTAGDAGFGCRKFLCVDKHRIKQIVDDAAVQFVLHRSRQFRKTIMENWIMRTESEVSYENFFSSFIQSDSN